MLLSHVHDLLLASYRVWRIISQRVAIPFGRLYLVFCSHVGAGIEGSWSALVLYHM